MNTFTETTVAASGLLTGTVGREVDVAPRRARKRDRMKERQPCRHARMTTQSPHCPRVRSPCLLKGQKALETGADLGIGKAIAIALGQAGAEVAVNYMSDDQAALPFSWLRIRRITSPARASSSTAA